MKRWLYFIVPFVLIVSVGVVAKLISVNGGLAELTGTAADPVDVPFAELDLTVPVVRTKGMAHYGRTVKQRVPGNLLFAEKTYYLYGLFDEHDTDGRAIRVLVRTERKPDEYVSYEFMELEGRLYPLTEERVPYEVEIQLGKSSNYFFADGAMILEPTLIKVDEDVWRKGDEVAPAE